MTKLGVAEEVALAAAAAWYHERESAYAALDRDIEEIRAKRKAELGYTLNAKGMRVLADLKETKAGAVHLAAAIGRSRQYVYNLIREFEDLPAYLKPVETSATTEGEPPTIVVTHQDGKDYLTVTNLPATHDATAATHPVLNYTAVEVRPNGLPTSRDDATLPLSWEIQHNSELRETVAAKIAANMEEEA